MSALGLNGWSLARGESQPIDDPALLGIIGKHREETVVWNRRPLIVNFGAIVSTPVETISPRRLTGGVFKDGGRRQKKVPLSAGIIG